MAAKDCKTFVKNTWGVEITSEDVESAINLRILPTYPQYNQTVVLIADLRACLPLLASKPDNNTKSVGKIFSEVISLIPGTFIDLVDQTRLETAFPSAVRSLIKNCDESEVSFSKDNEFVLQYVPPTVLQTTSPTVFEFAEAQKARIINTEAANASQFINSASYMGSKRGLRGFLVEGLSLFLPPSGTVVDLMCGSGVTAGAFNKNWRTITSDAQDFCRILSVVQGAGFSNQRALQVLNQVIPLAKKHADVVYSLIPSYIEKEDSVFHGEICEDLLEEYRDLITTYPLYPKQWLPEIENRKSYSKEYPYILFTSYFANVYFGIRQCVEIDSLRYAIDHLNNKIERNWAIGSLIAAVSALGTTYGGHFAQPKYKGPNDITITNLQTIIEKRTYSIFHEFSIRLLNLGIESESCTRTIETVEGPWQDALHVLDNVIKNEEVAVYVDAPYKREEYSRYYHVLETLVKYRYPACLGIGRTPDKSTGERFQSEFFTRDKDILCKIFADLFKQILNRGWKVAWSYSDSGDAPITEVLESVYDSLQGNVKFMSLATRFIHCGHRGRSRKNVTEYLIIMEPNKKI